MIPPPVFYRRLSLGKWSDVNRRSRMARWMVDFNKKRNKLKSGVVQRMVYCTAGFSVLTAIQFKYTQCL